LGLNAATLARYNGIQPDAVLRRDEIIALPGRVAEPSPATGAIGTGPIQPGVVDVTTLAGAAIDRAGPQATIASSPLAPAAVAPQIGAEPIRHQVGRGETAYSVARLYNVPVRSIAEWNGLGSNLDVREGQYLLIPAAGATAPTRPAETAPGVGSQISAPPSAAQPLPAANPSVPVAAPAPAPALPVTAPAATSARLAYPVQGPIIRAFGPSYRYVAISAASGSTIKAAAAGTIGEISKTADGQTFVIIRHANGLLTGYFGLDESSVSITKGQQISAGEKLGLLSAAAGGAFQFGVFEGTTPVDPTKYLP
jgi:murein DD-endopeptidase MepM/ murein hydrolase activator NlpD